jgi:diguanylate cyclase (GGDEF)-like protein
MWPELTIGVSILTAGLSCAGWTRTRRQLVARRCELEDLANSTLVIEEERRMLELMARGASLREVLDTLTRAIEQISPGSRCTVMLLDEEHRRYLLKGSGPSMKEQYLQAINGLEIGPDVGACGSAAYRNETVVVEDISTDYRFAGVRDFVMSYGLRSCWSVPIRDSRGSVLGTFAMYHSRPMTPRPEELRMTRAAAQLAGNAIERVRAERTLRDTTERLNLAERVAQFGIWESNFPDSTITISEGMASMMERSGAPLRLRIDEFDALVHQDDLGALRASVKEPRGCDETIQNEFRFVLPSGSVRWMRSLWRFKPADGPPTIATGALIDVTEEKSILMRLNTARGLAEASAAAAREAGRVEQDRTIILELVAKDKPLDQIVMVMATAIARHLPGSLCAIQIEMPDGSRVSAFSHSPEQFVNALARVPIATMQQSLLPQPTTKLSSDPEWQQYIESCGIDSLAAYRAVPILRNTRVAGLIFSFFGEARESCPEDYREDKVLESWGQFASLAVERRGLYEQLSFRARYDSLTTLHNRASLYESLDARIYKNPRESSSMAIVFLDLDHFKEINDCYGHAAGDVVLQNVSRHILNCVRRSDIAARIGGDEFVVILSGVSDRGEATRVGELIVDSIGQACSFNGRELHIGASFGISIFPDDGTETDILLNAADEDMYRTKLKRRAVHRTQATMTPALTVSSGRAHA